MPKNFNAELKSTYLRIMVIIFQIFTTTPPCFFVVAGDVPILRSVLHGDLQNYAVQLVASTMPTSLLSMLTYVRHFTNLFRSVVDPE
jgi:hypothetical protein